MKKKIVLSWQSFFFFVLMKTGVEMNYWKVVGVVCEVYCTLIIVEVAVAQTNESERSRPFKESHERNSSAAFKLPVAVLVISFIFG